MAGNKAPTVPLDWQKLDPYHAREQEKYGENALPSREFIMNFLETQGSLMTSARIVAAFGLEQEDREHLQHRLSAMINSGQLMRNREGQIGLVRKMDLLKGYVIAHPEGYGFFDLEGDEADGFIAPKYMQSLMHGDRILARINAVDKQGRKEYAPVEVLERAHKRIVGKLIHHEGVWFLVPENRRLPHQLMIGSNALAGARENQIVIAEILVYPTCSQLAVGKVVEVLGEQMAPGLEVTVAIENYSIPDAFPEAVCAEVAEIPDKLRANDYPGRLDIRHLPLVTIDGITARDFDDAVFAERRGENYRLYVAIADVSHYVQAGTPLDQEAYRRGTSVYFPDQVIPMLPEKLCNGLCSLNPDVDRCCIVCELTISPLGQVKRSRFHEAVMHSHARLTYETAEKILFERDPLIRKRFSKLLEPLDNLKAVYQVLLKARRARHTIEFDFAEAEFCYDSEGKIENISARERLNAHRLIEECMITANVAAARFLQKSKIPGLYRVHDEPSPERLARLREFVARIGLRWQGKAQDKISPAQIAGLLEKAEGREDCHLIEKMILRSMAQAVYSPQNRGHFGLALKHYAHFTSPIRRYPDLLVHRAIRHGLRGGNHEDYVHSPDAMIEIGKHCSITERRADDATRDAMDFLKCEFMSHRLGAQFSGQIASVTNFGFFVTLDRFFIDGLVHISSLKSDYYHYDADNLVLAGERSGTVFRVLDRVIIRVAQVNIEDKKIDFELIEHSGKTVDTGQRKSRTAKSKKDGKAQKRSRSAVRKNKKVADKSAKKRPAESKAKKTPRKKTRTRKL